MVAGDPVEDGAYRWSFEPSYLAYLIGQPWQPLEERRLDVIAPSQFMGNEAAIRADLVCRLQDLTITDIVPKEASIAEKVRNVVGEDMRRKIAEQHIKRVLQSAKIEMREIDNRFAEILIASAIAASDEIL